MCYKLNCQNPKKTKKKHDSVNLVLQLTAPLKEARDKFIKDYVCNTTCADSDVQK